MALNLKKHEQAILDAWRKVTQNEESYDWALYGYEGKTFALKVEAIGSGGIEALAEEFNDGKIQYGFVRVVDPNTKLFKLLLINFQGEAVLDLVHKGSCANHIREITLLLKNHLTITVTNIDDLDEDTIVKKLSKITSAYNFENRTVPNDEKFVIGTNYSKTIPTKEIDSVKRDEFWKKEEEVEKARVNSELEAKRLENLKIEEERLKREQREHLKREQLNKELEKKKSAISAPREEIKAISPMKKEELPAKPRAEELRNERRKEAQELIGNKVNTAKLMFQQQAAQNATKITSSVASHGPPAKPIRKTIHKNEPEPMPAASAAPAEVVEQPQIIQQQQQPVAEAEQEKIPEEVIAVIPDVSESHHDEEQFSTIKRSPKTPTTPIENTVFIISDNETTKNDDKEKEQQQEEERHVEAVTNDDIEQQQQQQQPVAVEEEDDQHLLKAVALYDYQASDETEISFDPGDLITHIDCIDPGWWQGFSVRFGTYGLFPANYVQLIDDIQQQQQP